FLRRRRGASVVCRGAGSAVFFFSSRRRHTRFSRDWNSDVCSSDLFASSLEGVASDLSMLHGNQKDLADVMDLNFKAFGKMLAKRSEERRVGKEGRPRGSAAHEERREGRSGAPTSTDQQTPSRHGDR